MMRFVMVMVLLMACMLTGCKGPGVNSETARELSQIPYPKDAAIGDPLDVLVWSDGPMLHLSNRTAVAPENVQLWLNQQYVQPVEQVPMSPDFALSLRGFINAHGESYPVGSLLAPDEHFPVVSAELFDPATGMRHPLTVIYRP